MKKTYLIIFILVVSIIKAQVIPTYETFMLKNGLKVYLLQYGKIPAINVKLVLNTGKVNEAPGQQNYSELVSSAILQGNTKYDIEAQSNKAFALGTFLGTENTNDNTSVYINILSKDLDAGLDIISAAVISPIFPKEKIDLMVSQVIDFNSPAKMDIAQLADMFSNYFIYGIENPLGRYFYKTQLQKVTPAIIKEYYDFNFAPKNANLIITGNFDVAAIKPIVEKYFGAWKSAYNSASSVSLESPSIKKREIAFVNRTGATQAALQWNKTAPSVKDKDALAFSLANDIFNRYLFQEIREKGGKTYSINSVHKPSKYSNIFSVSCSVRSSELYNTVALFDKTLSQFHSTPVAPEKFNSSVNKMLVALKSMENPDEVAAFYNPLIYHVEKRKNRMAELQGITIEEVNAVIKKYFTPDSYKLVIAADEQKVNEQLQKLKDYKKLSSIDIERDN